MDLDLKLRGTGSSKFERVQIWDMPFEHRPDIQYIFANLQAYTNEYGICFI